MIRILIVDDHASIRDSFRSAFEQYDDLKVVGSVADAAFALFFCRDKQPDLVFVQPVAHRALQQRKKSRKRSRRSKWLS